MKIITDQQLLEYCEKSVIQLPSYSSLSYTSLQVLFATGCRPEEAVDLKLWSQPSPDKFVLQPLKGNFPRDIDGNVLPDQFKDYFNGGSQEYRLATQAKSLNYFKKTFPTSQIYKGSKSVELYVFRYNYVKQLYLGGNTIAQIKEKMGWKSDLMAERYVFSVLFQI